MTTHATKMAGLAAFLLAIAATASADVKLNDNFSVGGYIAGAYEYFPATNVAGSKASDSIFDAAKGTPDANAVKTTFTASFKPITAVISLFYQPNNPSTGPGNQDLTVLDAYGVYDAGNGVTIKVGKYLTPLGYEAFDPVNMAQITYGAPTAGSLAAIPGYHTGVEADYSDKDVGAGLGLVDSIYSNSALQGDREFYHNAGLEGYATYKGVTDLVLWAGFAYDTAGNQTATHVNSVGATVPGSIHNVYVIDIWAQYQLTKEAQVAAEVTHKDGGDSLTTAASKGDDYILFLNYAFTSKFSTVLRWSGESLSTNTKTVNALPGGSGAVDYRQYTIAPSYNVSDNMVVRAEYSYYTYDGGLHKSFVGMQAIYKF